MIDESAARPGRAPLPPYAPRQPWVGNLLGLSRGHLDVLTRARERLGDVFRLDFGGGEITVVAHPAHAQHVLVDQRVRYHDKGPVTAYRLAPAPMMGRGTAMLRGDEDGWRSQRRALQPNFRASRLDAMVRGMVEVIDAELDRWGAATDGAPLDLERAITRTILAVVGETMLGIPIDVAAADRIADNVRVIMDYIWWANFKALVPDWVPLPGERAYRRAIDAMDSAVGDIVETALAGGDAHLLRIVRKRLAETLDGNALQGVLHAESTTLIVTGYESTAASLAWTLQLLADNPAVRARMVAETDAVLGTGRARRRPTPDDVPALAYTRMVFLEALRLYPPSYWGAQRLCAEDDEIGGHRIEAGTLVAPFQYLIQRHPDVWPDPDRFDPLRFEPEAIARRHPLAWLPFGAGQRKCPAQEFAIINGQMMLAQLFSRFVVEPVVGRTPGLIVTSNLRPEGGVWANLRPRGAEAT